MERDAVATEPAKDSAISLTRVGMLVMLSLFLALLNTVKPLTVDDFIYFKFADHIAAEPLDPYGFDFWGYPANGVLAPPAFLYWWAAGIRMFGPDPVLWKIWLLPISLLLVFCLHALGRRFARGMEMPFVFFVVVSSAVLPCLNLMLDIPALALGLLAIAMFLRACDTGSLVLTVATGIVAGVATQTKYTAFVSVGAIVINSLQTGQWRRGAIVVGTAGLLFVGWELLMLRRYGDSHFWLGYTGCPPTLKMKIQLIQPLAGYLGSMMAACLPLYLAVTGRSARLVWGSAALVLAGFASVAFVPFSAFAALGEALNLQRWPKLSSVVFGLFGVLVLSSFAMIGRRLLREPITADGLPARSWLFSVDGFLVLWLALEIAGSFVLSPHPAARRIIGAVVPGVLLAFRLAARTRTERLGLTWGTVGVSLVLGLFSFVVDSSGYYGQKVLAQHVAAECGLEGPAAKVWYFGDGAFNFYGDRLGMKRLVAPETPVSSGDWVVVVDNLEFAYAQHPIAARCVFQRMHEWNSILPMKSNFQAGNVAMIRWEESLVRVKLYRAR